MEINADSLSIEIDGTEIILNVSFDIPDKSFTCIVGPNGSGKSTILKAISREIRSYHGYISEVRLDELSYLPQNLESPPFLTVFDVVRTGFYDKTMGNEEELASTDDLLRQCGVHSVKQRTFADISAGEQQRVWLAFVIAQSRDLILMDEPLSSVDLLSRRGFYRLLMDISGNGKTLIVVTHDLEMAVEYGHHIIYLDQGIKKFEGDPESFRQWYW